MTFNESERRRVSEQDMNGAMQWLERRNSTASNESKPIFIRILSHNFKFFLAIGQLDETLYRKRNSVVNVRGSKDSLCIGRAQIKLNYDFSKCDFVITLLEGRGLRILFLLDK